MTTDPNDADKATDYQNFVSAEAETVLEADEGVDVVAVEEPPARKRPVWPFILTGGILLGFGASYAASYYTRPAPVDVSGLRAEIAALETQVAELSRRPVAEPFNFPGLERRLGLLEESRIETAPDTDDLAAELRTETDGLANRIRALEARELPEIDDDLVTRLETLQADGFEFDVPDVEDMRGQIRVNGERLDALESLPRGGADVGALRDEIDALRVEVSMPATTTNPMRSALLDPATLPSFPADRLREGAAEMLGEGFIRRSLSRHVRVKDEGSAEVLISAVEDAVEAGDVRAALAAFDRMPEELRGLARAWRAEMEDLVR